jgi:hypothetical protein
MQFVNFSVEDFEKGKMENKVGAIASYFFQSFPELSCSFGEFCEIPLPHDATLAFICFYHFIIQLLCQEAALQKMLGLDVNPDVGRPSDIQRSIRSQTTSHDKS